MDDKPHLLLVDDERSIREPLATYLGRNGFRVTQAGDAAQARERLHGYAIDLVVLDIMMPGEDGLSLCRHIRETSDLPVILLTAMAEETDRIVGLEMGADDYIVKPFSPKELVARVRALFRRLDRTPGPEGGDEALRFGELDVDTSRHVVRWAGTAVHLTAKEFALLVALLEARGRVLSRQQLLEEVWGYSYAEGTRTVDVHVRRLREKIPALAAAIITVKSAGYRLAHEG